MEQSVRSASTRMPACQREASPHDAEAGREAAVTAMLTAPATVTRPFSAAAEISLAHMVVDYFGDGEIDPILNRDIALRDLARAILAAAAEPDPIFAAMDKARALQAAKDALYCGHLPDEAPEWAPYHEAYQVWAEHIDGVLTRTVPTTAAGCIALARFTVDFCAEEGIPLNQKEGEQDNIAPLRLIAQSPALPETPLPVPLDPIIAAIEETKRLYAEWDRWSGKDIPGTVEPVPEWNAAQRAFHAHVDEVLLRTVPQTPEGCAALAHFAASFHAKTRIPLDQHPDEGRDFVEHVRILELIARSPLSLVSPRGGSVSAQGIPDLSEIPIMGLRNLFDRFAQSADYWNDTMHAGWARDKQAARMGFLEVNAAGELAEIENTRAASLRDAIAAEIARRPLSGDTLDDDVRLGTLIRFELMCNMDLRHAPVLRDAIAEWWSA